MMGRRNKKLKRGVGAVGVPCSSDGAAVAASSPSSSEAADEPGTGADAGGHHPHPLLNSVVLANLFRYCPNLAELCRWRLVCKTWSGESLPIWRSTATLKLSCGRPSSDPFNSIHVGGTDDDDREGGSHPRTTLAQFLTYLEGGGPAQPFRQFHLKDWRFAPPAVRKLLGSGGAQLDRFWRAVGPSLTSLTLSGSDFASGKLFGRLIFQSSPNLRSLTLAHDNSYCGFQRTSFWSEEELRQLRQKKLEEPLFGEHRKLKSLTVEASQPFPMTWLEFLSHVPCLEVLKLVRIHSGVRKEVLIAIDLIRQEDGGKLPLKEFDIVNGSMECSTAQNWLQYLDMFRRLRLPLRNLNIILDPGLEENQLKGVLLAHSCQLRKIEGWRRSPNRNFHAPNLNQPLWNFPFGVELTNLEELSISGGFCPSFGFLKDIPNLGKLNILKDFEYFNARETPPASTSLVSNTCELEFAEVRLLKLKTLSLGYKVKDNDLRRLINWFPNLEVLTMPLNDAQFSIVCEQWRGLRHFHVIWNELTNVGVTGNTGRQKWTKPNITLLENLTCFEIEKMQSALSDRSAFDGFLKLPNLQRLGLTSDSNDFGVKARRALKDRIPQCYLYSGCGGFGYNNRSTMFSCQRYLE